jgi:hypothetical protein
MGPPRCYTVLLLQFFRNRSHEGRLRPTL